MWYRFVTDDRYRIDTLMCLVRLSTHLNDRCASLSSWGWRSDLIWTVEWWWRPPKWVWSSNYRFVLQTSIPLFGEDDEPFLLCFYSIDGILCFRSKGRWLCVWHSKMTTPKKDNSAPRPSSSSVPSVATGPCPRHWYNGIDLAKEIRASKLAFSRNKSLYRFIQSQKVELQGDWQEAYISVNNR